MATVDGKPVFSVQKVMLAYVPYRLYRDVAGVSGCISSRLGGNTARERIEG